MLLNLLISGSASNGIDYHLLPAQLTIPAGETSREIAIMPYADAITELAELVAISIAPGSGYELGSVNTAQVTIDDLMPVITLSTLVANAYKDDGSQGLFLLSRSAVLDRSVLVRLRIEGTATNGDDYTAITTFISLPPGQTTALIPIIPLSGGTLQFGAESVHLSVTPDSTYRIEKPDRAEVIIAEHRGSLADWRSANFPELADSTLHDFGGMDTGNTGIGNLLRYAFALDPQSPHLQSSHLPVARIIDGHLALEFTRRLDVADLEFGIEASTDLNTWTVDPARFEDLSHTLETNDARRRLIRSIEPIDTGNPQYLRVRVNYKP